MGRSNTFFNYIGWFKRHWALSLLFLLAIALLLLVISLEKASEQVATALLVIIPASIFYIYSEVFNQPSVDIRENESEFIMIPMNAPSESLERLSNIGSIPVGPDSGTDIDMETLRPDLESTEGQDLPISIRSPVVRPVVFYVINVENSGKATAEDCMTQIRLSTDDGKTEYYGRWTDPASSDRYDLLPSQDHGVFIAKTYLTDDFFPGFTILNTVGYDRDLKREHIPMNISAGSPEGPDGVIRYQSEILPEDFNPRIFIPREKGSQEPGQSYSTSWIGDELGTSRHDRFSAIESSEYTIEARVIADNYRSPWREIDTLTFPDAFIKACSDKETWHDRWDDHFLQFIEEELEDSVQHWLDEQNN